MALLKDSRLPPLISAVVGNQNVNSASESQLSTDFVGAMASVVMATCGLGPAYGAFCEAKAAGGESRGGGVRI